MSPRFMIPIVLTVLSICGIPAASSSNSPLQHPGYGVFTFPNPKLSPQSATQPPKPVAAPGGIVLPNTRKLPKKVVALTFDDGPDPRYTPQVLSILREKGVQATFFMVGQQVEKHPELAIQAWVDGNEIGNHTYSHPDMKRLSWAETLGEVSKCQDVLVNLLGARPIYFRPPRGQFDNQDVEVAKAMGYKIVMWTVGIENHAMATPASMVDRVMSKVVNGSVILMHDGLLDRSKTVAALPILIDKLKAQGFTIATIADLLTVTNQDKDKNLEIIDYHHKTITLNLKGPLFPQRKRTVKKKPLAFKD